MESRETDFNVIYKAIMEVYHEKFHEYLSSKPTGSLTDSDVIIMIMNLTVAISTNIYYSLKQILPTTPMDFDFMKVKLCNSLADKFEEIKSYNPKESVLPLTVEQVKEITEKGFAVIKMPDGRERKIMKEEIMVKKEDKDQLLKEAVKDATSTSKIITPGNRAFRR